MYEDSDEDTEETALLHTEPLAVADSDKNADKTVLSCTKPLVVDDGKNSALDPSLGGVEGLFD